MSEMIHYVLYGMIMENLQLNQKTLWSLLLFPMVFEKPLFEYCWGYGHDEIWMIVLKRLLLLLPAACFVLMCWLSIACLLTLIIRQARRQFLTQLIMSWLDLFRGIFSFWAGILRFIYLGVGLSLSLCRLLFIFLLLSVQDLLLAPLRLITNKSQAIYSKGTPWLAVWMTLIWSVLEAGIFTFVTSGLVLDVLSGITATELPDVLVKGVLFVMMLFFVLGSYAILASFNDALKEKDVPKILQIGLFEGLVMGFEVMFLYREFVDALIPWFAQHASQNFQPGVLSILGIAGLAWMGTRGMTWYLFAGSGTPTILAIIKRTGVQQDTVLTPDKREARSFAFIENAVLLFRKEVDWLQEKSDQIIGAFVLPPMEVIAPVLNLFGLLIGSRSFFSLPFGSFKDLIQAKTRLSAEASQKKEAPDA